MRRRKLLLALAGLAALAVAVFLLWPPNDRVTRENYERIKQGMSRAEVEAILGPPGDYSTGPAVGEAELWWRLRIQLFERSDGEGEWIGNSGHISVSYDYSNGARTVRGFSFQPMELAKVGPFANILWRIKRDIRRWVPRPRIRDN